MKQTTRSFWTFALAAFVVGCAQPGAEKTTQAPPPKPSVEDRTDALVQAWDRAMNSGEAAAAVALYVPDAPGIMPPDMAAHEGVEGLRAHFEAMFAEGPIVVRNKREEVASSDGLVAARGSYTLSGKDDAGAPVETKGKWICIARPKADGSLAAVRNIWNVDAAPADAVQPGPITATGPEAAASAACHASPKAVDEAFQTALVAGDVAAIVADHAQNAVRMGPGRPALMGRQAISDFTQAVVTDFPERELELTDIGEEVSGDLGYTWGSFRYAYTPASGGEPVRDAGKYVAVATRDAAGCWKHRWVLWNSDTPWPKAE